MPADLMALAARVEDGEKPDRELDAAIQRTLAGSPTDHWYSFGGSHYTDYTVPALTSSLDAAVTVMESLLPGRRKVLMEFRDAGSAKVELGWHPEGQGDPRWVWTESAATTSARALLAATLRAIAAQPQEPSP